MENKKNPSIIAPRPRRPKSTVGDETFLPEKKPEVLWLPPGFDEKSCLEETARPQRLRSGKTPMPALAASVLPLDKTESPESSRNPKQGFPIAATLLVFLVPAAFFLGFNFRGEPLPESPFQVSVLPESDARALDDLLLAMKTGDFLNALQELQVLERRHPDVPSLAYLSALAALQLGDLDLAEKKARESLARRERVSDTLALLAVIEPQKKNASLGDPKIRAQELVREAASADPANPYPLLELATLMRYEQRNEEARRLLAASRARMNPVDSHVAVETSIALLDLEETPDEKLPKEIPLRPDPSSVFASAYLLMRQGDFAGAGQILSAARESLPAETYNYLVNDPALRKFARHPELEGLF